MKWLTALACGLFLIFCALFLFEPNSSAFLIHAAVIDFFLVLLAGLQFWRAATGASKGTDRIWYWLSIGMFIWCIAIVLRIFERILQQPDYGTLADSFYVFGYIPFLIAARLWQVADSSGSRQRLQSWAVLVVVGITLYVLFLRPLMLDPGRPTLLKALDLVYATSDLLMAGMLAISALKAGAWAARMIVAANVVFLVNDILFSYFGGSPDSLAYQYLDLPFTLGCFFLALAGVRSAS